MQPKDLTYRLRFLRAPTHKHRHLFGEKKDRQASCYLRHGIHPCFILPNCSSLSLPGFVSFYGFGALLLPATTLLVRHGQQHIEKLLDTHSWWLQRLIIRRPCLCCSFCRSSWPHTCVCFFSKTSLLAVGCLGRKQSAQALEVKRKQTPAQSASFPTG